MERAMAEEEEFGFAPEHDAPIPYLERIRVYYQALGYGAPYHAAAKFYTVYSGDSAVEHDLRIAHVGYDRAHTTAEDSNTWFPLPALRRLAAAGRIGEVAPRFHGAPTNRSHRATIDRDCPELLARVRDDDADAVILVAV